MNEDNKARHGSKTFYSLLDEMADTHDKKSHDYATNDNPFGNYLFAGIVANMFSHSPLDAGFAGRLAEKMYRLSVLEGGRKAPKNESIDDTERDIAVISTLWMAARKDGRVAEQGIPVNHYATDPMMSREVYQTETTREAEEIKLRSSAILDSIIKEWVFMTEQDVRQLNAFISRTVSDWDARRGHAEVAKITR